MVNQHRNNRRKEKAGQPPGTKPKAVTLAVGALTYDYPASLSPKLYNMDDCTSRLSRQHGAHMLTWHWQRPCPRGAWCQTAPGAGAG